MVNDHTPLPTVLQQLVLQYLFPAGCTVMFGGDKLHDSSDNGVARYKVGAIRLSYDTKTGSSSSPSTLGNVLMNASGTIENVYKMIPYKDGAIVYSFFRQVELRLVWHSADGSRSIKLPDFENFDGINGGYICVFGDTLIAETSNYRGDGSIYQTLDLSTLFTETHGAHGRTSCAWKKWSKVSCGMDGVFIPVGNNLFYFGWEGVKRFASFEAAVEGDAIQTIRHKKKPEGLVCCGHFVVDDTHILFRNSSTDRKYWMLSTVTWKWKQLPPLPSNYKVLYGSIGGRVVAVPLDQSPALVYYPDTESWIETDVPLVATNDFGLQPYCIACIE